MKTTKEAALALGVKPSKLSAILKAHPSCKPAETFGNRLVWTDEDIEKAGRYVRYAVYGVCPNCEWSPHDLPIEEATDAVE